MESFSVSMQKDLHDKVVERAKAMEMNFSQFCRLSIKRELAQAPQGKKPIIESRITSQSESAESGSVDTQQPCS
jgi:hypothetical protein